jgi:hypothetical protein
MSTKYPGGFITKSPVAPTTSAASGIWTLDQQQQAQKAGTWPSPPIFIEDMFSTYLYAGNSTSQTITNGINLSGQGGMVWTKSRTQAGSNHGIIDTVRGNRSSVYPNLTGGQDVAPNDGYGISGFNSTGYGIAESYSFSINNTGENYVSWTFAKQPKFFDIVTYTGTGVARTVAHSLGSVPGCMIVKKTSAAANWQVYHQSTAGGMGPSKYMVLNSTAAESSGSDRWNNTAPTSTVFTVGNAPETNDSGATYVAYLFAHDAGGFPVSGGGSTNGISCGSFTTSGTGQPNATINLGYEPQWIMYKRSDATGDWRMQDNMRGLLGSWTGNSAFLRANTADAESQNAVISITPTGFLADTGTDAQTYIYIAIRRGPMKPPTVGTSVFLPIAYNGTGTARNVSTGFVTDSVIAINRNAFSSYSPSWWDRLRGANRALRAYASGAELNLTSTDELTGFDFQLGFKVGTDNVNYDINGSYATTPFVSYSMQRAPGFFDEVCYTGTEVSGQTFTHNLGVVPEMMFVKSRSGSTDWTVYHSALGASARIYLNATNAANTGTAAPWNSTTPTSSVFSLGNAGATNLSGATFVNYLFATVAGVSKVGSYTGTGALLTVNCGFTTGARFALIKRTDSTGDWYVYDSARGITSGNDPYVLMNSQASEVTGTNYVDTDTTGFKVTAAAPAALNASGGTYIFLAIA